MILAVYQILKSFLSCKHSTIRRFYTARPRRYCRKVRVFLCVWMDMMMPKPTARVIIEVPP